jgi:SAM-dependent MidA family methyltransferase
MKDDKTKQIINFINNNNKSNILDFYSYIKIVLYNKKFGYYQRKKLRIGKNNQSDFYTSTSLGINYYKFLLESIKNFLINKKNYFFLKKKMFLNIFNNFMFFELGFEKNCSRTHLKKIFLREEFKKIYLFKYNRQKDFYLKLSSKFKKIIFLNEVLDAQPFYRFKFIQNEWKEIGVYSSFFNNFLKQIILPKSFRSNLKKKIIKSFPNLSYENYQIDWPIGSIQLLKKLVKKKWNGILIISDYGKKKKELLYNTPFGTARTYYKHSMNNNLLQNPGKKDITCHLCWDNIIKVLKDHNFNYIKLYKQEKFFTKYGSKFIKKSILNKNLNRIQIIKELIHPNCMGLKFQILIAIRF